MEENSQLPDWMIFVGKWKDSLEEHPLVYHMLDSASVASQLWASGLTPGSRRQFSNWVNLSELDCGRLLSYWTGLHDLGKATPSFQIKHTPTMNVLTSRGFNFPGLVPHEIRHHSLLSQWILKDFSRELGIRPVGIFNQFRFAIGGHHGVFHTCEDVEETLAPYKNLGDTLWQQARQDLFNALTRLIDPPAVPFLNLDQTESNAFFNLLTGFFVTADWISSQDDLFQYQPVSGSLENYWAISQQRANTALEKTGWLGWRSDQEQPGFSSIFGFSPNSLQRSIHEIAENLTSPFLMIIEAPTGCGKTEAALIAADRVIQAGDLRGCYVAMPTQATSNQMFARMKEFLLRRYPQQKNINLQLVHGDALNNEGFNEIRLNSVEDLDGSQAGNVNAMEWFLPRKRTLLAPFGVGTVDQTFLSVLRARHSFLRLFGLHHKVVIFDEVHAYDTYMQEIFTQLVAWLRAIGSSVIILSATLPEKTRLDLLRAFQPAAVVSSDNASYPRLSINDGQSITTTSLGAYPDRTVNLAFVSRDPQDWLHLLKEKLVDGGCAAVICNTVDRAQSVFQQIREYGLATDGDLLLLHARMPYCWRMKKEGQILGRYGKQITPALSPRRGIVVATQIIEQSLDLDFDLIITDLAPIDLLIQRIGRLHRHTGSPCSPVRPEALKQPLCLICQPDPVSTDELPDFEKDQAVYESAILLNSYYSLAGRQSIVLPADSDRLINQVYSDEDKAACSDTQNRLIREKFQQMLFNQAGDMVKAQNRLIGDVDNENVPGGKVAYLHEEEQDIGNATQALTRNSILPTVLLICFIKQGGQICFLDGLTPFNPHAAPYGEFLEHALRSRVSVSKSQVVDYFRKQPLNPTWRHLPGLRTAHPVVFENGICVLDGKMTLTLDEALGLSVV